MAQRLRSGVRGELGKVMDVEPRYRSLVAAGLGAEEATGIVVAALGARAGWAVHVVAPGRVSVARTRRPRWASVACACTVWLAGAGLLFLLVRRTDAGEVVVNDGPRGCVVSVPPVVDDTALQAVEDALAARGPASAAPVFASVGADDLEGRTVARSEVQARAAGPGGARAASVLLRFPAGAVRVDAGRPVVLGRDPSPTAAADGRVVPGDATTVSKSHLLVDFDGTTLTVEDLGSTNGSSAVCAGRPVVLGPGQVVAVAPGDEVTLGTLTGTIEVDRTGAA